MAKCSLKLFRVVSPQQVRNLSSTVQPSKSSDEYDVVIVGGGIVGVSSARELKSRYPKLRTAVVEKESKLAYHQSGHNSGVIHAGIYYTPGSLKARLCVKGMQLMYSYLDEKQIPYKRVGKLIVATDKNEVQRLDNLYDRALKNNVAGVKMVEGSDIQQIEPHCKGLKAIWSPNTGIVDYDKVTEAFGKDFTQNGGDIHLNFEVNHFHEGDKDSPYPVKIQSKDGRSVKAKYVLTCGGLYSDRLAKMSGCDPSPKIVPFRGEYLLLDKSKTNMVKGNIYPVPDPNFPFLGVHFTPRMNGDIWLGPNAVLAFKREGYKWSDISWRDLFESISYSGFRKLASKHVLAGLDEMLRSLFLNRQVKMLQKFIPEVTLSDVKRGPAGVRAQALDSEGNLVDDFFFDTGSGMLGKRVLHCRNAPSPGATSSLAIAKMVVDKLEADFKLST